MEEKLQITLTAARVNAGFSLDEVAKKNAENKRNNNQLGERKNSNENI